jgi:hypothetical protein
VDAKFEIRFLDVTWYDRDTVLLIKESIAPLTVEFDNETQGFLCNTVIYPKVDGIKHGQLAFRFLTSDGCQPHIQALDGAKIPLKCIVDKESGKEWWIEGNYWIASDKCWDSKAYRTAGKLLVNLGDQHCQINIGSSDFTAQQLDRYLSDFKSDLWELILDEGSYVTGSAKKVLDGGVSEDSIHILSTVLEHAQRVLKNPKVELREIQALKPRKKVKPVNRTFMELATTSGKLLLTSRATSTSYNVPENRYVLFVLERIYKILRQLVKVSKSKARRFEASVEKLRERENSFSSERVIDKELVRKDLETIKLSYDINNLNRVLLRKFEPNADLNSERSERWYLKINRFTTEKNGYFVGIKNLENDEWFETERKVLTVVLIFDNPSIKNYFEQHFEYEVDAVIEIDGNGFSQTGVEWYRYIIRELSSIKIIGGTALQRRADGFQLMKKEAMNLMSMGWIKKLTPQELSEQAREKKSVLNQIKFYEDHSKNVKRVYESLEPKLPKFKSILVELKALQVKPSSTFPNSMTFVQNPNYQAVHSGYKSLLNITNLKDEDLLLSLEKVDEIGLINMPILYERWCLLQIVKVLVQSFNYVPTHDWKRKLLNIVSTKSRDDCIVFVNDHVKRNVSLRYETTLASGKRPDFVLDVNVEFKDGNHHEKRFVMDAKYYSQDLFQRQGGISNIIKTLYLDKNYSEDGRNSVFILHPAVNTIVDKVSPQSWGTNSFLGELEMFDWDSALRTEHYHQYGAVCVNPVLRLSYLDELQRLIGMFLQYGVEKNQLDGKPDDVNSFNFCLACGSHDLRLVEKSNANPRSSWYECNDCKHFTTYNHCFSCDTRLIKNGDYWTYHSQMPMQPLNIKCPACESLI